MSSTRRRLLTLFFDHWNVASERIENKEVNDWNELIYPYSKRETEK